MFITFEGIEGCGKTTQIKCLSRTLTRCEIPHVTTLEPGGTEVGKHIRRILLDAGNKGLVPLAELMLYEADRAQHIEEIVGPALEQGKWVLCDRFTDATVAYQGAARGQDGQFVDFLNDKATKGIKPDRTFLLDCPVETGLARALARNRLARDKGQDRFEREKRAFHRDVRDAYLELAQKDTQRFIVIDAASSIHEMEIEILQHVRSMFPK